MTATGMRGLGWGAVVLGVVLLVPTGGVSLLVVLLGGTVLVVAGRRRAAQDAADAEQLLSQGRVRLHPHHGHDEAAHLHVLLQRARSGDPDRGAR